MTAASSPSSIRFKVRYWVQKKSAPSTATASIQRLVSQLAAARLPMVQRTTASSAPLLVLMTYRKKFETAAQMAERAVPARISFTEVALPPMLARAITPMETRNAPAKATRPT